jgi:hypothetical protein
MRPEGPQDWPFKFEWVPVELLFIDPSYQRPETRLVKVIAENFRPAVFGTVLGSRRDTGRVAIMDGQQRTSAARLIGVVAVPCLVYEGLTVPEEARIFVQLQRDRLSMRPVQRFKGELRGLYPRAIEIKRVLDARDIELVEHSGKDAPPDALAAITALETIFDRFGSPVLEQALDVITAAWPQTRGRFRGEVVLAVAHFIAQDDPRQDRLVRTLSNPKLSPDKLMERSAKLRTAGVGLGGGSIGYTVEIIRADYRKGGGGGGGGERRRTAA